MSFDDRILREDSDFEGYNSESIGPAIFVFGLGVSLWTFASSFF